MSIINYTPSEFTPVSFRHLLNDFRDTQNSTNTLYNFVPNIDAIERNDSFIISVEAAGMQKEDFKVELTDNNSLTISGERKSKWDEEKDTLRSVETLYGSFKRSFSLPEEVEINKIKAEYINGVLEVIVPKLVKVKKQPKLIAIK